MAALGTSIILMAFVQVGLVPAIGINIAASLNKAICEMSVGHCGPKPTNGFTTTTTSLPTTTSDVTSTSTSQVATQAVPTETTTTSYVTSTSQVATQAVPTEITTTSYVTSTSQVATQAVPTEITTTSYVTSTSQVTSQPASSTPSTSTSQDTTASQRSTILQATITSQVTTTSHAATTSPVFTDGPSTTTSQSSTILHVTSTSQVTTQVTPTTPGSTTSNPTISSQRTIILQTTTIFNAVTTSPAPPPLSSTTRTTPPQPTIPTISTTTTIMTIPTVPKTTSSVQSATSTRSPLSTPSKAPLSYVPDPGNYDLHLEFDLKVNLDYKQTYEDRTSPEFQSLATNFSVSLMEHFRYIKGFKSIEIIQFSPGSVIVDYSVNVYATVDIPAVTNQIANEVVDSLTEVAGAPVDIDYTRTSMKSRLEILRTRDKCSLASANLCPFGYYCKPASTSTILCIDRCNVSVCENNGLCYIGHLSHDVQCKCPISDGVVFTGERCEIKQVVMTIQERNIYLIIAGSIFGVVIFSFVLTVCIINRKRILLKKKLSNSLRMKNDELLKIGIKYVRDVNNRYVDGNNTAMKRYREHNCDTADLAYQGRVNEDADDGYLRPSEGVGRRNDSVYNYIN